MDITPSVVALNYKHEPTPMKVVVLDGCSELQPYITAFDRVYRETVMPPEVGKVVSLSITSIINIYYWRKKCF